MLFVTETKRQSTVMKTVLRYCYRTFEKEEILHWRWLENELEMVVVGLDRTDRYLNCQMKNLNLPDRSI